MEEQNILEKLKQSGLDICDGTITEGVILKAVPHYHNNFGFHHVAWGSSNNALLIKGVYKDFMRFLSGAQTISDSDWDTITKTLNDIEQTLGEPVESQLRLVSNKIYIISAEIYKSSCNATLDRRDYTIPRPLTNVEYVLPSSKLYDESVLLSQALFSEFFPNVLSNFTESLFEKLPDILNPVFVSCNLKTSSPSIVPVYGRIYTNITIFDKLLRMIGLGSSIFRASYMPHIYLKRKDKPAFINKSFFPVGLDEVTELLEELKRTINHISISSFTEDKFINYPVQFFIVYEYLALKLTDLLSKLLVYFPSISACLQAVYKTRKNSLFIKEDEIKLAEFFDVKSQVESVKFGQKHETENLHKYIKALPFFKRLGSSGKITKIIEEIHTLLDARDDTMQAAAIFIEKTKAALVQLTDHAIKKDKIRNTEDIFFMEHEEVRKVYYDTLYSDAKQTVLFRKWQRERMEAQVMPPEVYGKDFENVPKITETMVIKAMELAEYDALALNVVNTEGKCTSDLNLNSYEGKIIATDKLSPTKLMKYEKASAFILESVSPFSLTAEFAVLNNIGLYTGVRFARFAFEKSDIKIEGSKISKTKLN